MSTRGLLVFTESKSGKSFYKRMDSDPQCALNSIKDYLFPTPAERFVLGEVQLKDITPLEDDELDLEVRGHLPKDSDWGGSPNMQWVYIVDMSKKEIKIYGSVYGKDYASCVELIKRGTVNPLESVKCLYPEYQDRTTRVIQNLLSYLTFQGYSINPQEHHNEDNSTANTPDSDGCNVCQLVL